MIALALAVVLLGDSITAGNVSGPVGPSYAELLALEYRVTNIARGGATSRDWQPGCFLYRLAPPHLPAVAVVLIGTNDSREFLAPFPVEVDEYAASLGELVAALLDDGAPRVVLMTPPPNFQPFATQSVHDRLSGYRDAVLALCEPAGDRVDCGPDLHSLLGPDDFAAGNVHPHGPAHAFIASELAIAIPEPAGLPAVALLVLAGLRRRAP